MKTSKRIRTAQQTFVGCGLNFHTTRPRPCFLRGILSTSVRKATVGTRCESVAVVELAGFPLYLLVGVGEIISKKFFLLKKVWLLYRGGDRNEENDAILDSCSATGNLQCAENSRKVNNCLAKSGTPIKRKFRSTLFGQTIIACF